MSNVSFKTFSFIVRLNISFPNKSVIEIVAGMVLNPAASIVIFSNAGEG